MRRTLAVMIVVALAAFVARPERFQDMLWLWRYYGPVLQPRPGVSQPLGIYGYQAILLGFGFLWAIVLAAAAWCAVETFRWQQRQWLSDLPPRFREPF